MLFNSFKFILEFLPIFFICFFFTENKYKNYVVLIFSLIFYFNSCFDNINHFFIFLLSLCINFLFAKIISTYKNNYRKIVLIISIIFNILILIYFKYFNFIIDIFSHINNNILNFKKGIVLPLGISFYTMQIISYLVDVYNNKSLNNLSFIKFSTYISMFPQLIAGPIVRYTDIEQQLSYDNINKENIINGFTIFVFGLSSKVILANLLSYVDLDVNENILYLSSATCWLSSICSMLQLYFDFYGYSLMSKGLCKMMGIDILDNFNSPLLSNSITIFWRRWHISLSNFFRDYVYIPLGGNRNGEYKTYINLFIVFLITGIWHGADITFVIFGVLFGIFVVVERILSKYDIYKKFLNNKVLSHIYTFFVVIIIFVFFFRDGIELSINYLKNMFFINAELINNQFFNIVNNNYKGIILAIVFLLELPQRFYKKYIKTIHAKYLITILLFILDLIVIYQGYNDPFMYFRF